MALRIQIFFRLVFSGFLGSLSGMLNAQIPPCSSPPPNGGIGCIQTCVYCTLDGLTGNNNTFAAGSLCNGSLVVDRDVWFAFIPATSNISLNVTSSDCQNGDGFQLALLSACQPGTELDCNLGQANGEGLILNISSNALVPGQIHYLLIDGYLADICNYSIELVDGEFAAPPSNIEPLDGPVSVCIGGTYTYEIPPVEGAISYIITAPAGASINGQGNTLNLPANTSSVTITFGNITSGQICLTAVTSCSSPPPACITVADCCVADAGSLPSGQINACANLPAQFIHNGDEFLGPNDILEFILFTNPANPLLSLIARNTSPFFTFDPTIMVVGQLYYIAAIAGSNQGGQINLNDPCLDISNLIPLIWRPELSVTLQVPNSEVCEGACTAVSAAFTGTPPFQLKVNDLFNGDRIFVFNASSGSFQVCPPIGAPLGQISVVAVQLIDQYCTCE